MSHVNVLKLENDCNKLYALPDPPTLPYSVLKVLLEFATKRSHFIFSGQYYDQIDGVAMGSPLGPVLAKKDHSAKIIVGAAGVLLIPRDVQGSPASLETRDLRGVSFAACLSGALCSTISERHIGCCKRAGKLGDLFCSIIFCRPHITPE